MKHFIYVLWFFLSFTSYSSQENKKELVVEIHFQEGFNGEHVRVYVDDKEVFGKELTTIAQLGYAGSFKLDVNNIKSCLFVINDDYLKYDFKDDCPFLRVTYSTETKIMIECYQNPFGYN